MLIQNKATVKKETLLNSIYFEIIITDVWFLKLTVSNSTSLKNIDIY